MRVRSASSIRPNLAANRANSDSRFPSIYCSVNRQNDEFTSFRVPRSGKTLFSGLAIAGAVAGVTYQEKVCAHIATIYPHLIDPPMTVERGTNALSERPGLGARWLPELFDTKAPGYRIARLA